MNYLETRRKYSTFVYKNFDSVVQGNILSMSYTFLIPPDIVFTPRLRIPIANPIGKSDILGLVFHLGLIEAISYWKCTCSPNLIVEAGKLEKKEVGFWQDLYLHGLGEFYYRNNIDFTKHDFLRIVSSHDAPDIAHPPNIDTNGDLILVGGGKDSATTLEILSDMKTRKNVMMLNPTDAALATTQRAGYENPIIVQRLIDSALLDLNAKGYLNGHTPFSAYLSFLSVLVSYLYGYRNIVASNESSANEGSTFFHDVPINHQYSKSYRYEKRFRDYSREYLTRNVEYFSLLRPLGELQISALFSQKETYDEIIRSCNIGRGNYWCKTCPKCAFVYLTLRPFFTRNRMDRVFGKVELFNSATIQKHILDLVGLGAHKPFECVGTIDDSRQALLLCIAAYDHESLPVPEFLRNTVSELDHKKFKSSQDLFQNIKESWNQNNFLPQEYSQAVKNRLMKLQL